MHSWGDEGVDWQGISEAAEYIGSWLRRWGRVNVTQWKEKFGTVRVYCNFGWHTVHDITHPGYAYVRWPRIGYLPAYWLNFIVVPVQQRLYRLRYQSALRRWPHLTKEILAGADWPELLVGLGHQSYKGVTEER